MGTGTLNIDESGKSDHSTISQGDDDYGLISERPPSEEARHSSVRAELDRISALSGIYQPAVLDSAFLGQELVIRLPR